MKINGTYWTQLGVLYSIWIPQKYKCKSTKCKKQSLVGVGLFMLFTSCNSLLNFWVIQKKSQDSPWEAKEPMVGWVWFVCLEKFMATHTLSGRDFVALSISNYWLLCIWEIEENLSSQLSIWFLEISVKTCSLRALWLVPVEVVGVDISTR